MGAFFASVLARIAALGLASRAVWYARVLWPLACLLVAANYGLGVYARPPPWTMPIYFALGLIWWMIAACTSLALAGGLAQEAELQKDTKYEDVTVIGGETVDPTEEAQRVRDDSDQL